MRWSRSWRASGGSVRRTVADSHIGGTDTPHYDEGRTDGTADAAATWRYARAIQRAL